MSKRKRRISCGRYTAEFVFSRGTRYDCPKARSEKRHHTSAVQQALNDKNAMLYNAAVIAGTFLDDPSSMFVTLTLDDDHYPFSDRPGESYRAIINQVKNFIPRLRRLCKRRRSELAFGWSPGKGDLGRFHIHMLVKGVTAEDVRDVWGLGDVDAHNLYKDRMFIAGREWNCRKSKEINPEQIAQYMINNAKPLRKVGGRLIHFSRSCTRPVVEESAPVPDGYVLQAPEESVTCDQHSEATMYSNLQFVSYVSPLNKPTKRKRKLRGRVAS